MWCSKQKHINATMVKKLYTLAVLFFLTSPLALAQNGTLKGVVTSAETGETLPAVNVVIESLQKGTATDVDGNYTLSGLDAGTYTVKVSFIGFTTLEEEVTVGNGETIQNFVLASDVGLLDEIVVSGVADATPRKKLTVSVAKVDAQSLNKVPATSISTALSGKVSGVTIKAAGGTPGGSAQVQLRADNNLNVGYSPLVIVDGVILEGSLADINVDDIANIEVVKGAAASSLYGSRAGNGVMVVTTKRGANLENNKIDVTIRNEYGVQELENYIDLAESHFYTLATDWESAKGTYTKYDGVTYPADYKGGYSPDIVGSRAIDPDNYMDNPFGVNNNLQEEFFRNGTNYTNFVSVATRVNNINLYSSFENFSSEGIIPNTDGYGRKNFRINADYQVADWLSLSTSNLFINSTNNFPGGGGGIFFNIVLAEPDNNLYLDNPDGQPYFIRHNQWSNETNPLYNTYKNDRTEDEKRQLSNYSVKATPLDWLEYRGSYSFESINNRYTSYNPYDTWQLGGSDPIGITYSEGSLYKYSEEEFSQTLQHTVTARKQFGDLYTKFTGSYLWENRETEFFDVSGINFAIQDLPSFGAFNTADISAGSGQEEISSENLFGIVSLDYDDKVLVDAMLRQDKSSLFGENNRENIYYRVSGAYRLTEDFDIPNVNELKIRAARGTAGIRPAFSWQYETFSLSNGVASKNTLGNKNLKPSTTEETEFAINATVFDRVSLEAIYATSTTKDQFLRVPLLPVTGYNAQYQNAGTIESNTYEFNAEASIINKKDVTWNMNMTWSKSDQTITQLDVPAYQSGTDNLFYIREGETYGAIYGRTWVRTLDQMAGQLGTGETIADYEVNSDGYVVPAGSQGTSNEEPILLRDENGDLAFVEIGNGRPDWTAGVSNTVTYKGFSFYMLFDIKHGGDVYNRKSQWLTRDDRNGIMDQAGKADSEKKTFGYYKGFYDVNSNNSYWVEDAGYVKLRELSLSYSFGAQELEPIFGNAIQNITVSAIGRNLLTWTNYSGYDPEVGGIRNPVDSTGAYPNFRNYALSVQFKF